LGVELTDPEVGKALKRTAIENGVILRVDPGWFAISPPLVAEEGDLEELCGLIEASLRQAMEAAGREGPQRG
jgi:adenosylmethionine-8-amino-7-oxononanoate aminotransferase